MADKDAPISAEQFKLWLTPMQAQQILHEQWDVHTIRSTLAGRVGHKLLDARAEIMIRNVSLSNEARAQRVLVHQSAWSSDAPGYHAAFWENGRFDYILGDSRYGSEIVCHGVRFDPEAVKALLEVEIEKPIADLRSNPRRQDLPLLPEPIARAWIDWFKTQPNPTQDRAQKSALNMFPNHNLSRDRVRELFGAVQPGRPKQIIK